MNKPHISSGGVIYRISDKNQREILLLHKKNGKWHLPKGTQEKGEGLEETALREVKEETGFEAEIEKYLGKLSSVKENGTPKITHYFLMKPTKKIGDYEKKYDKLEWVEIEEAKKLLKEFTEFEKEEKIIKNL
jgi:8-oxo-dGTP diphosphatase